MASNFRVNVLSLVLRIELSFRTINAKVKLFFYFAKETTVNIK
jgi:hypothetical protein